MPAGRELAGSCAPGATGVGHGWREYTPACYGRSPGAGRTGTGEPELSLTMADETRLERWLDRVVARATRPRGAAILIATISTVITVAAGALMTIVDHDHFPTFGSGLWWGVQTVTTVGYGDVAPAHVAGRLVGAVVMLEGIAFIAIVTAVITSSFVARASREQAGRSGDGTTDRELMETRFDELERKIDLLAAGRRDPSG